jgi:hypothetical protein
MDALHLLSALVGAGLMTCAVVFAQLGRRKKDDFLESLSLACILFALTQFANAVPGWLRGDVSWIYLPRLAGFFIIIYQMFRMKLAK